MEPISHWLTEHALAVQAGAAGVSAIVAIFVAVFASYSARLFWLERRKERLRDNRFTLRVMNAATLAHELFEVVRDNAGDPEFNPILPPLAAKLSRLTDDARSLLGEAPDVSPRVLFLIESSFRTLEHQEGAVHPTVMNSPELTRELVQDLQRAELALIRAYESLPFRKRRSWFVGRDLSEVRRETLWEIQDFQPPLRWWQWRERRRRRLARHSAQEG